MNRFLRLFLAVLVMAPIPACGHSGGSKGGGTTGGAAAGTLAFLQALFPATEAGGPVTITVSRTGGSAGTATVFYLAVAGTAADGADFLVASGQLTWPDGDAADRTFSVAVQDDGDVEGSETVQLLLYGPTSAMLGAQSQAELVIQDDEAPAAGVLQFTEATVSIGENGATATITASRTGGTAGAVSVDFATADGTASASDYTQINGTLNWADGEATDQTFDVTIAQDPDVEGLETVLLSLSNPAGGAVLGTTAAAVLTIVDDDVTAGYLQFEVANVAALESGGSVTTIRVTRTGGSTGAVSVDFATADGSAVAADYTATNGTLNWADGDTSAQTFDVTVLDDALIEGPESFNLTLTNPQGGAFLGLQSTARVHIVDGGPPNGVVEFTLANYTVSEAGVTATITVTRTTGSTGAISVDYATSDGTATDGADYTGTNGTLSWADGEVAGKTFDVLITEDMTVESNESLTLTLSNATGGAVIGTQNPSTLTITDNDVVAFGEILIVVPGGGYSVTETGGPITITVRRANGSNGAVTVNYATSNGSAKGSDYFPTSGTLTWADGDSADKTFTVNIKNNDNQPEGDETFNVTLSGPTGGATLGTPSTTTVTIVND